MSRSTKKGPFVAEFLLKKVNDWIEDHYNYIRECEAERRMGA